MQEYTVFSVRNALNRGEHVEKKATGLSHHRILLYHFAVAVDGPAALAAGQGDAAPPAARFLACCLGAFEGFFGIPEIIDDHGGKATEKPCQPVSKLKSENLDSTTF